MIPTFRRIKNTSLYICNPPVKEENGWTEEYDGGGDGDAAVEWECWKSFRC